jgi:hypothetical protein
MRREEMGRVWMEVAGTVSGATDDGKLAGALVSFTVGFLMGGDMPHSAVLVIALAEARYGNPLWLVDLKRKVGLAAVMPTPPPGGDIG